MGHTLKTGTDLVREFEQECHPFARALLLRQDQELLHDLMAMIYFHSAPIAYAGHVEPFQLFVLAMNIGILKQIRALNLILTRHPELAQELAEIYAENNVIGSSGTR